MMPPPRYGLLYAARYAAYAACYAAIMPPADVMRRLCFMPHALQICWRVACCYDAKIRHDARIRYSRISLVLSFSRQYTDKKAKARYVCHHLLLSPSRSSPLSYATTPCAIVGARRLLSYAAILIILSHSHNATMPLLMLPRHYFHLRRCR